MNAKLRGYVDPDELRKAITTLQAPGKVFEVRVLGTAGKKSVLSGYFRDAETLIDKLDTFDIRNKNIYITLGEVKGECFSRSQSEHFEQNPSTTSDTEITRYRWLFVDLDPVRPSGISSSNAELQAAEELSRKVYGYLSSMGFSEPVTALSGNGYHLLYRIDVPNDKDGCALVEKCLKVLSSLFDTDAVKIDTTNSNPSRICKLHGTLAQKGRSTEDRPHRMSRILSVPEPVNVNSIETLKRLADELPEEPEQTDRRRPYNQPQEFDVVDFMLRNGMTYTEDSNDRAKIFKLDECPFDHNHKNGDAKIFLYRNGAIAFKCHHNSCQQYRWQDVRLKFEPDAYSKQDNDDRIDAGYQEHKRKQAEQQAADPAPKKQPKVFRKLKTAHDLMQKDIPEPRVFIGVGNDLPFLVEGTCILSAKPKLGKSWLALGMCLAVANGDDFLGYKTRKCSVLYLDLETSEALQQKRLKKMLDGKPAPEKFYLDTETDRLDGGFVEQIEHYLQEDPDIGLVVIDVFQIIRTPAKNFKENEYDHAYRDFEPLNKLAQEKHISIILVCHDRKSVDPDDPFSNILGSTGLQGAATQMIVMFKKQKDDPIHISVKGKTIDGLPELNVKLEDAQWSVVEAVNTEDREREKLLSEYESSDIRRAVVEIAKHNTVWKGRCSTLIQDAASEYGIPLLESPKEVGGFLHRHVGRFLSMDRVLVSIIANGTAPKIYKIEKSTIDTIDENDKSPLIEYENPDKYGGLKVLCL